MGNTYLTFVGEYDPKIFPNYSYVTVLAIAMQENWRLRVDRAFTYHYGSYHISCLN